MNIDENDDTDLQHEREDEREEVYSVERNEFGHPQMYQRTLKGDIPICAQCQCCVMPNRGQGTICDHCAHEIEVEQQHDYDEGILR
jgi:hypothetical protein